MYLAPLLSRGLGCGLLPGKPGRRGGWESHGTHALIFVALLQVTPAASPDYNFVGLAAEEQDAEVTPEWPAVPPSPFGRAFRRGCT